MSASLFTRRLNELFRKASNTHSLSQYSARSFCKKTTEKEVYNIGTPLAPYSTAVKANGFIFVSGQLGVDSSGKFVASDVEGQTEQTLNNLKNIIDGMGSEVNKICKTTVLLSDINDFAKVNAIYSQFFKDSNVTELPARAAYAVANLPLNAKVEIEAIVLE